MTDEDMTRVLQKLDSISDWIKALTISQYVLMVIAWVVLSALLLHAWIVKEFVK